ncbi:hypothetical protein JCM11251_002616 [Rhodosporidiobolus azoricus]
MDELRCNNLRCRKSLALEGSAVVTTCSHIFCIDCANALFSTPQICPACETSLTDVDDIMQTSLNPHDSYKTSILSGLAPAIILDIASRALNFYTYQVQQEAAFQALITKNAQERISILDAQLNTITREAQAEVALYKERAAAAEKDLELERRRVREMGETHKANAKAYSKLKAQYDKAKQRALLQPGDPSFPQAFSAHSGNTGVGGGTPAATRQTFIPASGSGANFSRSNSTASVPGARGHHAVGGWGVPSSSQHQQQQHVQPFGQAPPGSTSRARRPLLDQQNFGGSGGIGSGGFGNSGGGGGGQNTMRKLNLAAATGGGRQKSDELPQFLGQGTKTGGGGGGRGAFRPAALPGSRHSS